MLGRRLRRRKKGYPVKNGWPALIGPIHRDEFREQARTELEGK